MRLIMIVPFLILFCPFILFGQVQSQNSMYVEIAGSSVFYSISYERMITPANSIRVGVSYFEVLRAEIATFPIMINHFFPVYDEFLEVGAGVVLTAQGNKFYSVGPCELKDVNGTAYIGYRNNPDNSNVLFRFGIATIFNSKFGYRPGLSFGFLF